MRTFLLISPCFAPQGTVAAYRWVKLARHIGHHGFRPIVLSATFPDDNLDPSLAAALPRDVVTFDEYLDKRLVSIVRATAKKTPKRSSPTLQPIEGQRPFQYLTDRYWAHGFHATSVAIQRAREFDAKAVVVSAGPYSAVPIALRVARKLRLPLILDFRDPYGLHETGLEPHRDFLQRIRAYVIDRRERQWLHSAAHIVLNTRHTLDAYRAHYPFITSKSSFIRNHYDLGLYDPVTQNPDPPKRFTILHTGTLRTETRLDDIGAALRRLIDQYQLGPDQIVLRQIGRTSDYERAQIAALGLSEFVEIVPPIPQAAMLRELRIGHLLLSMVEPQVKLRIAAKTYDYIAAGIPILSLTENTEVDELLAHRLDNKRLSPGNIDGLVAMLSEHFMRFRQTRAWPTPVEPPREFSSEVAAERFAKILEGVMTP